MHISKFLISAGVLFAVAGLGTASAQVKDPANAVFNTAGAVRLAGGIVGTDCLGSGSGCPQAIPDSPSPGITANITVTGCGSITDVNIGLDITHTWVGDLRATVTNMNTGTSVVVMDMPGGVGSR